MSSVAAESPSEYQQIPDIAAIAAIAKNEDRLATGQSEEANAINVYQPTIWQ